MDYRVSYRPETSVTDRQTDGQTDWRTDRQTECKPIVPSGFTGGGLINNSNLAALLETHRHPIGWDTPLPLQTHPLAHVVDGRFKILTINDFHLAALLGVSEWVNWLFNVTINDISVIYVTAHRCAGGLKKKFDLRSGSQRHRHFAGFFNVPVLAPTRDQPFYMVIPTHRPI